MLNYVRLLTNRSHATHVCRRARKPLDHCLRKDNELLNQSQRDVVKSVCKPVLSVVSTTDTATIGRYSFVCYLALTIHW